ncbi:MAG: methyltransferase domain-containing protein, partial [Gammaproteobacteria bacterium]|nr:methyltransferase domain-containing protein [Gammaproteobacteria bacterium]
MDKNDQVKAVISLDKDNSFSVPPSIWHRLVAKTNKLEGEIDFYCHPIYYFYKKYQPQLTKPHGDIISLNERYLKTLFKAKQNLNIFDMGCGRGRNSLYLAQQGHKLTSVDIDEKKISVLEEISKKEAIKNIQIKALDLEKMYSNNYFDVVLLTVVLQFLDKGKIWDILSVAQSATNLGGLHSIVCPIETSGVKWPEQFSFILKPAELREFYLNYGWAILEYNEDFGH